MGDLETCMALCRLKAAIRERAGRGALESCNVRLDGASGCEWSETPLRAGTPAVRLNWARSCGRSAAVFDLLRAAMRAFWVRLPLAAWTAGRVSSIGLRDG